MTLYRQWEVVSGDARLWQLEWVHVQDCDNERGVFKVKWWVAESPLSLCNGSDLTGEWEYAGVGGLSRHPDAQSTTTGLAAVLKANLGFRGCLPLSLRLV